jgi:hypothetical protein
LSSVAPELASKYGDGFKLNDDVKAAIRQFEPKYY